MTFIDGMGYDFGTFSVKREIEKIEDEGKLNPKYYVFLTDYAKKSDTKKHRVIHRTPCKDINKINELRELLLSKGLKDMGIKPNHKRALAYLYIIDKY